jgi:rsbT antagonist protein RsbS
MDRIPILRMGKFLLVSIQVDMHDQLAMTLQDDLTSMIERTGARGVLIDISALEMVDSFIGRMIANISGMSRILDAHTVVVGMQPAVAITGGTRFVFARCENGAHYRKRNGIFASPAGCGRRRWPQ